MNTLAHHHSLHRQINTNASQLSSSKTMLETLLSNDLLHTCLQLIVSSSDLSMHLKKLQSTSQ